MFTFSIKREKRFELFNYDDNCSSLGFTTVRLPLCFSLYVYIIYSNFPSVNTFSRKKL